MQNPVEKFFKLSEKNTTIKKELLAGAMTFAALSYIIFLLPAVLRQAGMSFGASMTATCVASALMCLAMGLIGNFPVPQVPSLSAGLFFTFSVVIGMGFTWQQALPVVLVEGLIFTAISAFKVRDFIANSIPASLRYAASAGMGIFMVMLGFKWAGISVPVAGTLVGLGKIHSPAVIVSILGILAVLILFIRQVKGSLIIGTLITLVIALIAGVSSFKGIVSIPISPKPLFLHFTWPAASALPDFIFAVLILLFLQVFDSLASELNGKQPGAFKLLLVDSAGSPVASILGLPNIGSSLEGNAGGVGTNGKSGLANVSTGVLFLLAMFLYPVIKLIGTGVALKGGTIYPVAAPVLVILGMLTLQKLQKINLADLSESFPAIVALLVVPFTFNPAHGIAFGIITYPIVRAIQGKFRDISILMYILAGLFLAYYIFFN